jgi:WD40 repeat protein
MPPSVLSPAQTGTGLRTTSENLFVENYNDITEYDPNGKLVRTITDGIPYEGFNAGGLAFDSRGRLYAITGSFDISIYAAGSRKFIGTITSGLRTPLAVAVDRSDNLFVANEIAENVEEFFHGHKQPGRVITQGINDPDALAFDSQGNLYVANLFGPTVTVYSRNGHLIRTIQDGMVGPEAIALDSRDTLFVANGAAGYGMTVTIYKAYSDKRIATLVSGQGPGSVAISADGELFVANADSNTATAYQEADWRWPPLFEIKHVGNPRYVLVDASNNFYLVCCNNRNPYNDQRILVYPPWSEKPARTITDGVTSVRGIAFGPP